MLDLAAGLPTPGLTTFTLTGSALQLTVTAATAFSYASGVPSGTVASATLSVIVPEVGPVPVLTGTGLGVELAAIIAALRDQDTETLNTLLFGGNDTFVVDGAAAGPMGLAGDDTITGGTAGDQLEGGSGNDSLDGGDGNDRLFGDDGNDTARGGTGNDRVEGLMGDDSLSGGDGNDTVTGDSGNDTLSGDAGGDRLDGGIGNDSIDGGAGGDTTYGDVGADTIDTGDGNDVNNGAQGRDLLSGGLGADTLFGDDNYRPARATDADTLNGGDGDDIIFGMAGGDRMFGDAGNDILSGGAGNDLIVGGAGADTMIGGSGADVFRFASIGDFALAPDVVADFQTFEGDKIDLRGVDADATRAGNSAFVVANSGAAGTLSLTAMDGGVLVSLFIDGTAGADAAIFVNNVASLSATDFML